MFKKLNIGRDDVPKKRCEETLVCGRTVSASHCATTGYTQAQATAA